MPIVVNPGFVWPPESEPVVSPDGRITAIVDPAHAGVLLRADFDDSVADIPAQPEVVQRTNLYPDPALTDTSLWSSAAVLTREDLGGTSAGNLHPMVMKMAKGTASTNHAETGDVLEVSPGDTVTLAGSLMASAGHKPRLRIYWYSGSSYLDNVAVDGIEGGTFQKLVVTGDAPATATSARVSVWGVTSAGGSTVGDGSYVLIDGITVERGATDGTYFDGDTEPVDGKLYRYASDGTSEE